MQKRNFVLFIMLLFAFWGCSRQTDDSVKGNLIIIGGGKRPAVVMEKFLELAGGQQARIAVIPMASEYYLESGQDYEKELHGMGVAEVKAFYILDSTQANSDSVVQALSRYTGFYFGGGDQNRLTKIFLNTRSMELFHRKYREGAVLGGTSAGAAIMSKIMITGDGNWSVIRKDSVIARPGFGFVDRAIIDQHFVKRSRFNRLLALVIQNKVKGVGIDESTALWVKPGGQVEVMGESCVLLLDPSKAAFPEQPYHDLLTAKGLQLSVLHAGDYFKL